MRDGYAAVVEVAEVLGVSENTVRNRIKAGLIPARVFREGNRNVTRIPISWLVTHQGIPTAVVEVAAQFLSGQIQKNLSDYFFSEGGETLLKRLTAREGDLREQIGYWRAKYEETQARVEFLVRRIDKLQAEVRRLNGTSS